MVKAMTRTLACLLLSLAFAAPLAAQPLAEQQLIGLAEDYVELLDQARYGDAWENMTPLFKSLNDFERWTGRHQAIRDSYGPLTSRSLNRIDRRQTYGQSPDGRYVIVQFQSVFKSKASTNETVILDCRSETSCSVRDYIIR